VTDAWQIPGADEQPLLGDTHLPDGGADAAPGVIVLCHGFKGYKDYGFFPRLARDAAAAGLIAHRFNFSHSGMTREIETFAKPELFEADTWSKQVHDVKAVVEAVERGQLAGQGLPIVLFGHSRGGVSVLLAAAELGDRVAGVVAASSPQTGCSLDEDQKKQLRRSGRMAVPSSRTGQTLYVGKAWLEEIEADPDRCDPAQAAGRIERPVLILHGKADDTVPWTAAHVLNDAPGSNSELRIIENASHTFNCPNPLPDDQQPPAETREMIDATVGFALGCVGR